jgi:ribosomal protein L7/L12
MKTRACRFGAMTDNITEARVGRLEREVAHLYAHLGIEPPQASSFVSAEVRTLALSGKAIHAIKLLREQSDMDLATAKQTVDEIIARGG